MLQFNSEIYILPHSPKTAENLNIPIIIILVLFFSKSGTWSFTLRIQHILRLIITHGICCDKNYLDFEDIKNIMNEDLYNLISSFDVVGVVK